MTCCAFIFLLLVTGCSTKEQTKVVESPAKDLTENVSQQMSVFTLSSVGDDGQSNWQLQGSSADIVGDDIGLKDVCVKSQSKDSTVTMKAKTGLIKKAQDLGIFKEDVVLAYEDGTTLNTDTINWSFKKEIADAPGPVLVKSGGLNTKADGACLKKGINEIQLNKNIVMTTDTGTVIKCSGPLLMDYKKNTAVFNDNVEIENEKGKMFSKKMVVFFDPGKKKVNKVEASGGVRLLRNNSISVSENAVYFAEEGRAVLTGNPVVYIDKEEARKAANE